MKRIQTNFHSVAFNLHPVCIYLGHRGPPTCANTVQEPCITSINLNISLRSCFEQKKESLEGNMLSGNKHRKSNHFLTSTIVFMCQLTFMQPFTDLLPCHLNFRSFDKNHQQYITMQKAHHTDSTEAKILHRYISFPHCAGYTQYNINLIPNRS